MGRFHPAILMTFPRPPPQAGLMHKKTTLRHFCWLIITAALQASNAAPVKLTLVSGYPVVEDVYLNGQGPFRFLLDTGAQTNQLDASLAARLGFPSTFRTVLSTLAGDRLVGGGRIAGVRVGTVNASDQEFVFRSLEAAGPLSGKIHGVLGQEFLHHFDYLLDFRTRRIVFGAMQPDGADSLPLESIDGRPAIQTDKGRMVIDSGAPAAILYSVAPGHSDYMLLTASGESAGAKARGLKFRAGGKVYSTTAILASRGSLTEDGVVPASMFHAIYICNSQSSVTLDPRHF